jgi:hypothetical protein
MQRPSKACARRPDGLGWNFYTLPASELPDGFGNSCLAEIQREMNFFPLLHEVVALLGVALARVIEAQGLSSLQKQGLDISRGQNLKFSGAGGEHDRTAGRHND